LIGVGPAQSTFDFRLYFSPPGHGSPAATIQGSNLFPNATVTSIAGPPPATAATGLERGAHVVRSQTFTL
jgi:hypothetical protein